jgi:hypothetical protein
MVEQPVARDGRRGQSERREDRDCCETPASDHCRGRTRAVEWSNFYTAPAAAAISP